MSNIKTISLSEFSASGVLSGAALGAAIQARVLMEIESCHAPICCLDFQGVECATASFVREAVFGTRDALRRAEHDTQVIIANAAPTVIEDILVITRAMGTCIVHVISTKVNQCSRPTVLGTLDQAQRETLCLVLELEEATATELATKRPEVKTTAWNNRLTGLVGRGLLIESRRDRHKVYQPVIRGLTYGV